MPAAADTSVVVGRSSATADAELPAELGLRLGMFKKHGLDVKFVDFTGGGKLIQAMVAGSVGIGVGAATGMALVAKGAPMLAICENTATLPYFAVGVPWDSDAKVLSDLKGKKIGVASFGSLTEWLAQGLRRKQGWGPDEVTITAIGSNKASPIAAFRQHQIDAYVGATIDFEEMAENKIGRLLAPVSTYMGRVASGAIYATTDMMKNDPETVRAFLAAWVETTAYIGTHKDEIVKVASEFTGYAPELVSKEYDIDQGMYTTDCRFDKESLDALQQSFLDLKLLDTAPDMSTLYTSAFVPK